MHPDYDASSLKIRETRYCTLCKRYVLRITKVDIRDIHFVL